MKAKALPSGDHVLPTAEGYDRWAEVYETDGNPLTYLEEPLVAELLGEVAGLDVADIGCGTGRHAIALAERGAAVTALDFSDGMLLEARKKKGAQRVKFITHDLHQPLPLADASFDRVLCCLVVEHIVDLDLLFGELGRICRPHGSVVVTAMHPAMMLLGTQAGFDDPMTGQKIHPKSHDHQICDFVMASARAGLSIDLMSEHRVDERLANRRPRAEKYLGWPLLLTMRLRPARTAQLASSNQG